MLNNEMLSLLDKSITYTNQAKVLMEKRSFYEALEKSYYGIFSTVKAVTEITSTSITPIDLLYETEKLVDSNTVDQIFYEALYKAIVKAEKASDLPIEMTNREDAQTLFNYNVKVLKKAKEIYDAQRL